MKLLKIILIVIASSILFLNVNQKLGAQDSDPCKQINMCAAAGTTMQFPDWPMPISVCPWPDGTSICCVTCGDS
jgi:hypothetical protein